MSKILGIDTSGETCSVAYHHKGVIIERRCSTPREHSQQLLPLIDEVLGTVNQGLKDLDALAFGCGPGSFTGLRLSAAVIQGLAFSHNLPVLAISSLQALAHQARRRLGAEHVLVAMDARMQQVYWACYHWEAEEWTLVGSEQVVNPAEVPLPSLAGGGTVVAIGRGWASYPEALRERFAGYELIETAGDVDPLAQDVVSLALTAWQAGEALSPAEALPIYIRNQVTG
jgi:tRNA threonylcarbamoyladenosine biosynthesis protein TsaB